MIDTSQRVRYCAIETFCTPSGIYHSNFYTDSSEGLGSSKIAVAHDLHEKG